MTPKSFSCQKSPVYTEEKPNFTQDERKELAAADSYAPMISASYTI